MKRIGLATSFAVVSLFALVGCSSGAGSDEEASFSSDDLSAPTCAPSLANGAVPAKHRAMLDTIGFTEGTAGHGSYDGYNVTFGYTYFSSCVRHPDKIVTSGGYSSSAAGRYQFLYSTWTGLHLPNFEPNNQDVGGMKLVAQRGVTLPTTRALTATEFANAMARLSILRTPSSLRDETPPRRLRRARALHEPFPGTASLVCSR